MRCIISRTRKLPVPAPRSSMPTRTITLAFAAIPASVTGLSQSRSMSSISSGMEWVWNLLTAFALLSTRSVFSSCSCSALTLFRSNVWAGRIFSEHSHMPIFRTFNVHDANHSGVSVTKLSICRAYNGRAFTHQAYGCGLATDGQNNRGGAAKDRQTEQPDGLEKEV